MQCPQCGGHGRVNVSLGGFMTMASTCDKCAGSGKVAEAQCKVRVETRADRREGRDADSGVAAVMHGGRRQEED